MQPIEDSRDIEIKEDDGIFSSEDDMKESLSRLCYGDLSLIGKLWIEALQAVLVGGRFKLIPTVVADMGRSSKEHVIPKKPSPMKFKDLPIYECPHYEYKDYIAKQTKCPGYKDKVIYKTLLPYVSECRKKAGKMSENLWLSVRDNCKSMNSSIRGAKNDFKASMRHPDNLTLRQGVLAAGTMTGFLLGGGGGVPRRFFFTSLGALAAGSLCFPKQTDEYFRESCYHSAKELLAVYNATCGKNVTLRERVPCRVDMPEEPKPRKVLLMSSY